MSGILVALDGLPGSEKALQAAVRLAQQDGPQLTAISVLELPGDPHLQQLASGIKVGACRRLEQNLQAAVNFARARGVLLTPVLREGHPADEIVAYAEQAGTDLLVLGSHNGADPHPGLGRTADQVSSHAPCTVWLVK